MLAIVHLSDMHLKESKKENPILERVDSLVDIIKNDIVDCTHSIIVFSGDIAFSGKNEEYKLAELFFKSLFFKLRKVTNGWISTICVPGNHDCEFTPNNVRDALLEQANNGRLKYDENVIEVLCETQKEYFEFIDNRSQYSSKVKNIFQNKLYNKYEILADDFKIIFHCFNSASFSKLKEMPGNLHFPLNIFENLFSDDEADISISTLHHPLNWMNSDSHRELRNKLIEISDLVFTGHEHVSDDLIIERKDLSAKFIESGALQDNNNHKISQFGLLLINTESDKFKTSYKKYSFEENSYNLMESTPFKIGDIKTKKGLLNVANDFKNWLEELGAPIAHPRKENPYLDDFYVAPDVQVVVDPDDESTGVINEEHIIDNLFTEQYCAIIGTESSGKTTFLKKVFEYKFAKGFIPILIEGEKINKFDYRNLYENILKKAFGRQYEAPSKNYYSQISRDKIVILIDNFGACPLTEKNRVILVENLKKYFSEIFFTARELIHFDPINTQNAFENFKIRKILELSHENRKKIILKWNSLGQLDFNSDSETINYRNVASLRFISNVINKHFTEPYPIYILTLLQVQDANSKTLDHGSIGFYYEYLIKHSLQESINNKTQATLYETFLREFCYFLFDERINNINEEDFQTFLQDFLGRKRVSLGYSDLRDDLLRAKIIRIVNGQVSIHQQYIYYYFVSTAIDKKLDDPKVMKRVSNMIDRIYVQEFEGIILFLSHLSSNSYVLTTLRNKCKTYFTNFKEATIDQDILAIDKIIEDEYIPLLESHEEPTGMSSPTSPNKKIEKESDKTDLENDPDSVISVVTSLNKFVRAIKTFELMGNIAKINYSWDYEEKVPLIKDTYGLGLRLLSAYYEMIEKGAEEIISHVKQISSERDIESLTKKIKLTKDFTFQLTFTATYNIIKRISYSLGHKQLRPIFKEISKDNYSNANKLVEFAVDLLQLGLYSESDVKKYLSDSKGFNRPMARLILRNFVYEYTQLYKIDIKTRQRIHSDANIKIHTQRRTQNTSKRIKNK